MDDEVRMREPLAELRAEVDARELLAGDSVGEHQRVGVDDVWRHPLEDPEPLEDRVDVRPHLDAVADLAELRGLLEHSDPAPLERQRERGGQAADPTAGDEDFRLRALGHGAVLLPSAEVAAPVPTSSLAGWEASRPYPARRRA